MHHGLCSYLERQTIRVDQRTIPTSLKSIGGFGLHRDPRVRSARHDPSPPRYPCSLCQPLPAPTEQSDTSSSSLSCRPSSMTNRFCAGLVTASASNIVSDTHGDPEADTTDVRHWSHTDGALWTPGPSPDGCSRDRHAAISCPILRGSPRWNSWPCIMGFPSDDPETMILPTSPAASSQPMPKQQPLLSKRRASCHRQSADLCYVRFWEGRDRHDSTTRHHGP